MDVDGRPDAQDQTVKKMVRYALACEYQRMPIRRSGISEKGITSGLCSKSLLTIQSLESNEARSNGYSTRRRHNYGQSLVCKWWNYLRRRGPL